MAKVFEILKDGQRWGLEMSRRAAVQALEGDDNPAYVTIRPIDIPIVFMLITSASENVAWPPLEVFKSKIGARRARSAMRRGIKVVEVKD